MAFGLYKMLGFRFAPRFRDLADQRFWRADLPDSDGQAPADGYGPLEAVACNKVNLRRIETHWPDMLRVAGSLITNQVRAYDLLRMFGREGHPTPLGAAFAEYGRIDKTMHLLAVVDPVDDTYRRLMNRQLTVRESRHRLARAICHGGRGQIRQAYREGQEDQLAALGLVLNAVALWNTRYLDATVAQLRAEGLDIKDEDIARLSPLKDRHINFMGRYLFNIKASGPGQGLRPLRDPDPAEAMWATTEPARYLQWRRGTYQPELSERWFGEAVAVPGGCGRFAHRLLEDSYSVFDAAEVDETLGTERAAESRVPFEDCGGFLSAASFGKHVGQDPGRVPGVALGVRPRLLDRLIEQAAVGHERKPHPEEVPVLLAVAATPESIKVGQAVPGPVMVGVQGAKSVDDPVLRTVLGERAHHLDRLVAPSVPDQELGQRYSHMPHAVRRSTECAVGGDRAFHVAAFLQHFGKALRGVPVMLGSCVRTQFRDPVVPGQQVRQLVTAVDEVVSRVCSRVIASSIRPWRSLIVASRSTELDGSIWRLLQSGSLQAGTAPSIRTSNRAAASSSMSAASAMSTRHWARNQSWIPSRSSMNASPLRSWRASRRAKKTSASRSPASAYGRDSAIASSTLPQPSSSSARAWAAGHQFVAMYGASTSNACSRWP